MLSLPIRPQVPDVVRGWSLWVPLPPSSGKPKWINLNERAHWGSRSGKTAVWRSAARLAAEEAQIPVLVLAWVQAYFTFGDTRRRDVHNYLPTVKACVDGFTDAGIWADDSDGILIGPDLRRSEAGASGVGRTGAKRLGAESVGKGISFMIWEVADGD